MASPRGGRGNTSGNRANFNELRGRGARGGRGLGRGAARSSTQPNSTVDRAPRQVCDFFWSDGTCQRGFDCIFRHERRSGAVERDSQDAECAPIEFFTLEGLSLGNGTTRSTELAMKPSEVHNHLKIFLQRQRSLALDSAYRAESFVRIFGSVNKRNSHWVCLLRSLHLQLFLDSVVNGDALLLVSRVLEWDTVSCGASTQRNLSFQKGYFPLLEFYACDLVFKTTVSQNINKLFAVVKNNYNKIHDIVFTNVGTMIQARNWNGVSGSSQSTLDGIAVFEVLTTFYSEFFSRFRTVIRENPLVLVFVENLASWFNIWRDGVNDKTFVDPIASSPSEIRAPTLAHIGQDVNRLLSVMRREYGVVDKQRLPHRPTERSRAQKQDAMVAQLTQVYDPPGDLRDEGPRHDNDAKDIQDIRIAPTYDELVSPQAPYLPCFVPDAPHHLPANSMQKHLDIQFRFLREELISTVRQSINVVMDELKDIRANAGKRSKKGRKKLSQLANLLSGGGGTYRSSGQDSVFFHLYPDAQFSPAKAEHQKLTIGLRIAAPPGAARDKKPKKRAEYWVHARRLSSGNMIALVLSSRDETRIFLGTLQSSGEEIGKSAMEDATRIEVRVAFFDAEIELYALRNDAISDPENGKYAFLIDNSVLFESVRPFLETLQTAEPTAIPFSDYIAREGSLAGIALPPPRYSRAPRFKFDLSCLMRRGMAIDRLDTQSSTSIARAREQLINGSILDRSQANSVIDALTREISLIQGPPGTGKSFTGKELLRVLFKNQIRPIVLIAFTNHALDHMLRSVIDSDITNKIVRLGSRSTDEVISHFNLGELERNADRTSLHRTLQREFAGMKEAERDMKDVLGSIQIAYVDGAKVREYLDLHEPELARKFDKDAPAWIQSLHEFQLAEEKDSGAWTTVGKGGKAGATGIPDTLYGYWSNGCDLDFISPPSAPVVNIAGSFSDPRNIFFSSIGYGNMIPPLPIPTGEPHDLTQLEGLNPWSLPLVDRVRLAGIWEEEVRRAAYAANLEEFKYLRGRYLEACQNYENVKNESRRELLRRTELIGCTTTGAAKLVSLLNAISPKVLMVEEAGQVLEAHILASLVPSVQHLIEIGDPQQLRPTLANYRLSMDHPVGGRIYRFDRSLMERLADNGAPMSLINVQRRMRPQIADYPSRLILYPMLTDHRLVLDYPDVQGMRQNVFFLTHTHQEGGDKDTVSKHNMFEVEMIRDLVMYFLKQGPYTGKGDIAVLCAYLGQLQKVRAALKDARLAVAMDERDEAELERLAGEEGKEAAESFDGVEIAKHIRLGTVDTFQGEEAKIVIISLVRNSGDFEGDSPIGFLRVINRVNVALSRAKHGQYILGNAANLRHNATWATILDEMEARGQLGHALPTVCPRHPNVTRDIDGPNQLPLEAPEGGCLVRCDHQLKCGHTCPSVCHPDLELHARMRCRMPCPRIKCPRQHPCPLECGQPCGDCAFPIYKVRLPCGHVAKQVQCHEMQDLASVKCNVIVTKQLSRCEHSRTVKCHEDPAKITCQAVCGGEMPCCSRACTAQCFQCRELTNPDALTRVKRTSHVEHPCERLLYCQHRCGLACSKEHECNKACQESCWMHCTHHSCRKPCSEPCPPCMERCMWACPHQHCPVPCGSICTRLPCDEPCQTDLPCGHRCPSICGEPCADQRCIECMPAHEKTDIVDLIMGTTIAELNLRSYSLDQRVITLACGHIFTVETLDGHCQMSAFYEVVLDPTTGSVAGYIDVKAPPISYQTPPSCPTCRGPIAALRYGRVVKRAYLDIVERNVASQMSKALGAAAQDIAALDGRTSEFEGAVRAIKYTSVTKTDTDLETTLTAWNDALVRTSEDEPTPPVLLDATKERGFGDTESREWRKIVKPLTDAYRKVTTVAVMKGPHVQTYQAALATLYRLELEGIRHAGTSSTPEPDAMRCVDKLIGQPPRKADMRFQVDAFLYSIEVRLRIAHIARVRCETIKNVVTTDSQENGHRRVWVRYIELLYESCYMDATAALDIANQSYASRQAVRCIVLTLRVSMEMFRFQVVVRRDHLRRECRYHGAVRQQLVDDIRTQEAAVRSTILSTEHKYLAVRPIANSQERARELAWFAQNGHSKANKYIAEYTKLAKHIEKDAAYAPLSTSEMEDVVRALSFGYRGHFYNCENGHTFVITECGGATQEARCPECNCPIGGTGHQLHSSNTRAMEYENIAREQGGLDPHWEWGQGA
ncbi:hypothetical protein HDZ31DRAFT_30258 [Schizophyllum fasciatum]